MKSRKSFDILFRSGSTYFMYDEPSTCPLCKCSLKPHTINGVSYFDGDNRPFLSIHYYCTNCSKTFIASYSCARNGNEYSCELDYIAPNLFKEEAFDARICTLSPQFVKIYNQASSAEASNLDEIAGIGYRKAIEFLVKDFCTHLHPDNEDEIKSAPLSRCIKDFINNDQIKTLASRAVWIGNDETHYIRKQENRDITDMKNFIQAMVYFIGMSLLVEDAASISPA